MARSQFGTCTLGWASPRSCRTASMILEVGGRRNLDTGRLEKLLVSPVDQAGDLAAQHPTWPRQHHRSAIRSGCDLRRAPVFADLEGFGGGACTVSRRSYIKLVSGECRKRVGESSRRCLLGHKFRYV